MPCKHEGGTDLCERYSCGNCKALTRSDSKRRYYENVARSKSLATDSDAGQAGELLVAADLLHRGYAVTKPLNINGEHDLHVEIQGVWYGVQVKVAAKNVRTGQLNLRRRKCNISSPIIGLVFLPTKEIRYEGNPDLPDELK